MTWQDFFGTSQVGEGQYGKPLGNWTLEYA